MKQARTLFARTGIALTISLIVFLVFSIVVVIYFVLAPVAKRAADDLASLMVLSTQTWVELPPGTRPDFEDVLLQEHRLRLGHADDTIPEQGITMPYLGFLRQALEKRVQASIPILVEPGEPVWYSVDIPMAGRQIRISFPRERIGAQPPLAALLLVTGGAIIILLASLVFVRRLTGPLSSLSVAAAHLGRGNTFRPLTESGPRELVTLTRSFNDMAKQIHELMDNRTTLLSGISHDLRTPITRMRLSLELIKNIDDDLKARLAHDLDEMNELITHALELARDLGTQELELIDLQEFIEDIITGYRDLDGKITWQHTTPCPCEVDIFALRRVLTNLIDNALRYGGDQAIAVSCDRADNVAILRILDRGEGIPADMLETVFRPFQRLENSRNRSTGGSGLGLSIAKHLSDRYQWGLTLSARQGGGTVAQLTIPLIDRKPQD